MDFSQALDLLRKNNHVLKAAHQEEQQAIYEQYASRALFLPQVSLSGVYTQMDDPLKLELNEVRDAIIGANRITATYLTLSPAVGNAVAAAIDSRLPSFEKQMVGDHFWRAGLDVSWPIFTGGRILAANRAANEKLKAAKEKTRMTHAALVSELARLYFGLQLAMDVEAVRRAVVAAMELHYEQAKKMEENGLIARVERLHAEVALAESRRQHLRAVHDRELAQTALNHLLSLSEPIVLSSPLFMHSKLEPLSVFREQAQMRNPALKELEARKGMAHQAVMKEIGTYAPQVALFGTREIDNCNIDLPTPKWAVGVSVSFLLFDGMARYHKVHAANTQKRRVEDLALDARRKVDTLVEMQYQELTKAQDRYETLKTATALSEEYLRIRKRAFEEGMATSLDVVDAELNTSKIKIEKLQAMYDYDVALARLLEASGLSDLYDAYRRKAYAEVTP
jgi:outer membrane protein TolC